ncbi:MAG: BrnT family toxin [Burkholderiales bacterium]|nr:BrnT family toxin [Burkholderiales bacterium]
MPGRTSRVCTPRSASRVGALDVATLCCYIRCVYEWDEAKREINLSKHGIDFRDAHLIFEGPLVTVEDDREDYGERRFVALGLLADIVISMIYAERGERVRVISIRKALKHEARYFLAQVRK